jgi:hypothetical protein
MSMIAGVLKGATVNQYANNEEFNVYGEILKHCCILRWNQQ